MKIVHVHAVYKGWPVFLVVETDTGDILELCIKELKEDEDTFEGDAWKQLIEDYRVFYFSYH
jgi:hypothetical protein